MTMRSSEDKQIQKAPASSEALFFKQKVKLFFSKA
jgi:hypothetical protein